MAKQFLSPISKLVVFVIMLTTGKTFANDFNFQILTLHEYVTIKTNCLQKAEEDAQKMNFFSDQRLKKAWLYQYCLNKSLKSYFYLQDETGKIDSKAYEQALIQENYQS